MRITAEGRSLHKSRTPARSRERVADGGGQVRACGPAFLSTLLMLALAGACFGQVATGFPPFGSFSSGAFDSVDLANLNAHFQVPVTNKAGRGIPFYYLLNYDTSLWSPVSASGTNAWTPAAGWGWAGITSALAGQTNSWTTVDHCVPPSGVPELYRVYYDWFYVDPSGTTHTFDLITSDAQTAAPDCVNMGAPPYQGTATATDGSGYTLHVTNANYSVTDFSPRVAVRPVCPGALGLHDGHRQQR